MKRYWILVGVVAALLWLTHTSSVFAQAGLQTLRETPKGTMIYKVEDRDGICYVAEHLVYASPNRPAVSISCLPRVKR